MKQSPEIRLAKKREWQNKYRTFGRGREYYLAKKEEQRRECEALSNQYLVNQLKASHGNDHPTALEIIRLRSEIFLKRIVGNRRALAIGTAFEHDWRRTVRSIERFKYRKKRLAHSKAYGKQHRLRLAEARRLRYANDIEYRERARALGKASRQRNAARLKNYNRQPRILEKQRIRARKNTESLSDVYVRQAFRSGFNISAKDIPQQLVDAYREKLKIVRVARSKHCVTAYNEKPDQTTKPHSQGHPGYTVRPNART